MARNLIALLPLLLTCACAGTPSTPEIYLKNHNLPEAIPASFPHCYNYGCNKVENISLTTKEWNKIEMPFATKLTSADDEKAAIKKSIQNFENIVGKITGTENDIYGTFRHVGFAQQDCIDESTNTTIYLSLLHQRGNLKFHTPSAPDTRMPFFNGGIWPHRTAVMIENETQIPWAVDSWFHDNGFPPEIIPLAQWKSGWKPQKNLRKPGASFINP